MTYTLDECRLRVVRQVSKLEKHTKLLRNARLLVLEHILPTTEEFLTHLNSAGADIFCVLAKPYSIDQAVLQRIKSVGIPVEQKSYKELDESTFLDDLLLRAATKSKEDGRKIVIVDVGGYFAAPLIRLSKVLVPQFAGVVEDTTFGHNRYLAAINKIPIPVFSAARSALKEVEARFVGKDAVAAMDFILRKQGVSLTGRNALVLGYGMIGKSIARSLKASDLRVCVYDRQDHKNLAGFIDGFHIHRKRVLLESADIIYAATGNPEGALSITEIEDCKDDVILVSVGSRNTEFDIDSLKRQALGKLSIGDELVEYRLHNKKVIVARDGTAINFSLPSIPIEVLDLVFSEILTLVLSVLENPLNFPIGRVHDNSTDVLSAISKGWLRFVNR